jgi:hypothetical protein
VRRSSALLDERRRLYAAARERQRAQRDAERALQQRCVVARVLLA